MSFQNLFFPRKNRNFQWMESIIKKQKWCFSVLIKDFIISRFNELKWWSCGRLINLSVVIFKKKKTILFWIHVKTSPSQVCRVTKFYPHQIRPAFASGRIFVNIFVIAGRLTNCFVLGSVRIKILSLRVLFGVQCDFKNPASNSSLPQLFFFFLHF